MFVSANGMTGSMRTVVVLLAGCWSACATREPATPASPPKQQHQETAPQGSAYDDANTDSPVENDANASRVACGRGSGWGSIGTGTYQEIGHDSGTPVGHSSGGGSGVPPRGAPVPNVSLGQPTLTPGGGVIDNEHVRRYIKRNLLKFQSCYEQVRVDKPTLAGTVTAKFTIEINGSVSSSSASGIDAKLESCVAQTIQAIEFPKQTDTSTTVDVVYPVMFRPTGC